MMATRWAAAARCCPSPPGLHFWLRLELPPERVSAQDGETNGKPQHLHFLLQDRPLSLGLRHCSGTHELLVLLKVFL